MKKRAAIAARRLLAAARNARRPVEPAPAEAAPPGFARRVVAIGAAGRQRASAAVWTPSWRPVAAAVCVLLLSLGMHWSALRGGFGPRDFVTTSLSHTFYQP